MKSLVGRELLDPSIREEVAKRLPSAFADEWLAAYYYTLTAETIQGPGSDAVAERFREEAMEEIGKHAKMIAERLSQLGYELPRDFAELAKLSGCGYPSLPSDPFDHDAWLLAAIRAEQCAIDAYKELYELVHGRDPVTEELVEDLLADEVRHMHELAQLLSREAFEGLS